MRIVTFLILVLVSCQSHNEGNTTDISYSAINDIELSLEVTFGSYEDEELIVYPGDFIVDPSGRLYVVDMNQARILVYNPDGSYLTKIGSMGRGPGQFMTLKIGFIENQLFVYDSNNSRISYFDINDYELLDTELVDNRIWSDIDDLVNPFLSQIQSIDENTFLVKFLEQVSGENGLGSMTKYYLTNKKLEIISEKLFEFNSRRPELYEYAGMTLVLQLPLMNTNLLATDASGRLYYAWSEELRVDVYDTTGQLIKTIEYPYKKVEIDERQASDHYNTNEFRDAGLRGYDYPEYWPAIKELIIDTDNNMWISTVTESDDTTQWLVFDNNGSPIGKFQWEGMKLDDYIGQDGDRILITGSHFYQIARNNDLYQVEKYRIEKD